MSDFNYSDFEATDEAFPTSRVLPDQWEQENLQEWAEHGTINGQEVTVFYLFDNTDCEDASEIPFDEDHVDRIELREASAY